MGKHPRINLVKTIDGGGPAELGLATDFDAVTRMLRNYVDSVVADFQDSWTPEQYLAANKCAFYKSFKCTGTHSCTYTI